MFKNTLCLVLGLMAFFIVSEINAADTTTSEKLILGSWYCPTGNQRYQRFDFSSDRSYKHMAYYEFVRGPHNYWSESSKVPQYKFRSPTEIQKGAVYNAESKLVIENLTADSLDFTDVFLKVRTPYRCTRARPPGDTDASRASSAAAIENVKKKFYGKWATKDNTKYYEFFSDGTCAAGTKNGARWIVSKEKFSVTSDGDIGCGSYGRIMYVNSTELAVNFGIRGVYATPFYRV